MLFRSEFICCFFCLFFLVFLQVQICKRSVEVMDAVRRGAQLAIDECQFQFRNRRWNCSTLETMPVFGKVVTQGKTAGAPVDPKPTPLPLKATHSPSLSSASSQHSSRLKLQKNKPNLSVGICKEGTVVHLACYFQVWGILCLTPPPPFVFFFILHELHR